MKVTCLFYFVSQVLKLLLIKGYMIQLGFRWVLRRVLEARERARRLSKWRKTFRITVHFSSNIMQPRSTLQIALLEMQLQLALKLHFKVSVADCSPEVSGLHLAMLILMLTIKIQRWQFFADIVYLSLSSINLPHLNFFLSLSKQLVIHIRTFKAL